MSAATAVVPIRRGSVVESNMRFKTVMMTPEWAIEILKNNHPNNRNKKQRRITQYARDMRAGLWRLTHQGIAIDEDGNLVDGQNRLEAVIEAECEVPMLLVTDVPRHSMVATDNMAARNVADAARISGNRFEINEISYGSTARTMLAGDDTNLYAEATHQEILEFVKLHKQAIDYSFECLPRNTRGLVTAPVRAVIARAYYRRNERNRVREFCTALISGLVENSKTDVAVIRLRNWLADINNRRTGKGQKGRLVAYRHVEWALNIYLAQGPCERLGIATNELFPLPEEKED